MIARFLWATLFILFSVASHAKELRAQLYYCTFFAPGTGPYVEVYLTFDGKSLEYKELDNGNYQGAIEVTLKFFQKDSLIQSRNFMINSPETEDPEQFEEVLLNQERIAINNGNYEIEINVKDVNSDNEAIKAFYDLQVQYPNNTMSFSDVETINSITESQSPSMFTKSGYDIIPYSSSYFPRNVETMQFYVEIYNAHNMLGHDETFLLTYHIESTEKAGVLGNYRRFERMQAKEIDAIVGAFDIKELASGNYNLVIEARNQQNELMINKKMFFQRSNPGTNEYVPGEIAGFFVEDYKNRDSLEQHILYLEPIASNTDWVYIQNQVLDADMDFMKQYFLNFWVERDKEDPEGAWFKYYGNVQRVNKNYGTRITKGYLTDRGFRYLRYGAPNSIYTSMDEPNAYPYEIWHYHQFKDNQTNRKFVFYNPSLVTNDFVILHSNAIGEVRDDNWHQMLHQRTDPLENLDQLEGRDHYGGRALEYYNLPR